MKTIATILVLILTTPAMASDMAGAISQYRRAHGLSAVKSDHTLTAIAQRQANAMAASNVLDHGAGGSFVSRISTANASSAAENIAVGTRTWADTFRMWKSSAGHNANLLRRDGKPAKARSRKAKARKHARDCFGRARRDAG